MTIEEEMELLEAIGKRHSYRGPFQDQQIPRSDLKQNRSLFGVVVKWGRFGSGALLGDFLVFLHNA